MIIIAIFIVVQKLNHTVSLYSCLYFQVTAGTLDAFSYVQWPEALLQLSNYAKFVQLNLVQIAPIHCFKESLKVNAYVGLAATVSWNVGVIILAFMYFQYRKIMIRYDHD